MICTNELDAGLAIGQRYEYTYRRMALLLEEGNYEGKKSTETC